jgi:hypothetical protein
LAVEGWTFAELAAAGWSEADIDWESASKTALQYLAGGDLDRTREEIAKSLRIANAEFSADDPRLGASLANHGAALIAGGKPELSRRSLGDAVRIWRSCDPWVAKMTAPRAARSSLFHLRMEQRHRPTYEARWRIKWAELVDEARERIGEGAVILASAAEASERVARWQRECPAMLNDTRKLMGAVLLLACRHP